MKKGIGKQIVAHVAVLGLLTVVALVVYPWMGGCPSRALFAVPCPACGMTRSAFALVRLDFRASFFYHPLTVPTIFVLIFAIYKDVWRIKKKTVDWILISAALVLFLTFLARLFFGTIP